MGAFNGLLVWKLRLPPIVVTLGTMSIYRGSIYLLSQGAWVNENEMSPDFVAFTRASSSVFGAFVDVAVRLPRRSYSRCARDTARDLYAAGGNPEAASYSGIDAGRMQFIAYTICGAIAGVCGYLWVARFAVAYTDIALGFEAFGDCRLPDRRCRDLGRRRHATGVLLGCLFIGIIRSSLPWSAFPCSGRCSSMAR